MEGTRRITIAELLRLARPLNGAAYIQEPACSTDAECQSPRFPPLKRHKPAPAPSSPSSKPKGFGLLRTLATLKHPTILIGVVHLPGDEGHPPCGLRYRCLSFSDDGGKSSICCDLLDFEIWLIGKKVYVLSWNFIPFKQGGGVLEIIRWKVADAGGCPVDHLGERTRTGTGARGLLASVSPVFTVPCKSGRGTSRGFPPESCGPLPGFIAELVTCECDSCRNTAYEGRSSLDGPNPHSFTKPEFVYFHGSASRWHPVLAKLVGIVVTIDHLKEKHIRLEGDQNGSHPMLVSTETTLVNKFYFPVKVPHVIRRARSGKNKLVTYTGVVTAVYMQGILIELDEKVFLLLTDPLLVPGHSIRIGAIVSARNVHPIHPKFSWTREEFVLGACMKSNISVKLFSPCRTQCPAAIRSHSLFGSFMNSLSFTDRLWLLLLLSSFRQKFVRVFTDKEVLGSNSKEGLTQIYASLRLGNTSQDQLGFFNIFCKHEVCSCRMHQHNSLKLMPPLSNFIKSCEVVFATATSQLVEDSSSRGLYCEGKSYKRLTRRFMPSKVLGHVLVGFLRVSQSLGRLQLVDATGSIDVVVPDFCSSDRNNIYEVKDYILIIEGLPVEHEWWYTDVEKPLTCRHIFQHTQCSKLRGLTVYVHFYLRDSTCLNTLFQYSVMNVNDNFCGSSRMFYILLVSHVFPAIFNGGFRASGLPSTFSEAFMLPYRLILEDKITGINEEQSDCEIMLSAYNSHVSFNDMGNYSPIAENDLCKIPCLVALPENKVRGFLMPAIPSNKSSNPTKVLLEFMPDAFHLYQKLHVGGHYIVAYQKELGNHGKIVVDQEQHLWTTSFSSKIQSFTKASHRTDTTRNLPAGNKSHERLYFHLYSEQVMEKSETQIYLPSEAMELFRKVVQFPNIEVLNVNKVFKEIIGVSSCIKAMFELSQQQHDHSVPRSRFAEGKLVTICGHVLDFHDLQYKSQGRESCWNASTHDLFLSWCSRVCIHVHENNDMVRVQGSFSNGISPLGLGPGVNATFHRLLITSNSYRWHELTLLPLSFVVVNTVEEVAYSCTQINRLQEPSFDKRKADASRSVLPTLLIQSFHLHDPSIIRLRCRVAGIFVLALEKDHLRVSLQEKIQRRHELVENIPIAGFILDDGSSTCCCWADGDRAATLLWLNDILDQPFARKKTQKTSSSRISDTFSCHLDWVLKKHQQVIVRNYGAVTDPSCMDFMYIVNSNKLFGQSEERVLRSILFHACLGPDFDITGNMFDLNAFGHPIKELIDFKIAEQHTSRNLWLTEVNCTNTLLESRRLLDELSSPHLKRPVSVFEELVEMWKHGYLQHGIPTRPRGPHVSSALHSKLPSS